MNVQFSVSTGKLQPPPLKKMNTDAEQHLFVLTFGKWTLELTVKVIQVIHQRRDLKIWRNSVSILFYKKDIFNVIFSLSSY